MPAKPALHLAHSGAAARRVTVELSDWAVGDNPGDAYLAPEHRGIRLSGRVKGHPKHHDGKLVVTSPVRSVAGRTVRTASGSTYLLVGEPEPGYLEYLQSCGRTYDPVEPIKLIGGRRRG